MTTQPLPTKMPGLRPLSAKEEVQRQAAAACAMNKAPNCDTTVHVGIFFDGTNNNKERDQADSPPSHSNIVVLHDAYRDDPSEGYYKFYVPGVGTAFPQIGEPSESDAGKAYGTGGDARINWALIQLVNAIHRSAFDDRRIVPDPQAGRDASTEPLHNPSLFEFGANFAGKRVYFVEGREAFRDMGRMKPAIQPLLPRLRAALARAKGPQVKLVNLSVFGFSRGAAQARAFCDQLQRLLGREGHGAIARLRGTPARS